MASGGFKYLGIYITEYPKLAWTHNLKPQLDTLVLDFGNWGTSPSPYWVDLYSKWCPCRNYFINYRIIPSPFLTHTLPHSNLPSIYSSGRAASPQKSYH